MSFHVYINVRLLCVKVYNDIISKVGRKVKKALVKSGLQLLVDKFPCVVFLFFYRVNDRVQLKGYLSDRERQVE